MTPLFTYHNGMLLQRLEKYDHGPSFIVYNRQMLDKDKGTYIRGFEDPETITLDDKLNPKCIYEGNIVLHLLTEKCAIVSHNHSGFILPYNFMHIEVDTDRIDPSYFVYWWDWSTEAHKQRYLMKQGSTSVQKIIARQLQDLHITLPSLEEQQRIGRVNQKRKRLHYLQQKREALMDKYLAQQFFRRHKHDND